MTAGRCVFRSFFRFVADERGTTAIEYSLIIGVIFLAIVAGVRAYTAETTEMYQDIQSSVVAR